MELGFIGLAISLATTAASLAAKYATAPGGMELPKYTLDIWLPMNKVQLDDNWREKKGVMIPKGKKGVATVTVEALLNAFTCAASAQGGIGAACLPREGGITILGLSGGKGNALSMLSEMRDIQNVMFNAYIQLLRELPVSLRNSILSGKITLTTVAAQKHGKIVRSDNLGDYIGNLVRIPVIKKSSAGQYNMYEFYDEVEKKINAVFKANGINISSSPSLADPIDDFTFGGRGNPTAVVGNALDYSDDEESFLAKVGEIGLISPLDLKSRTTSKELVRGLPTEELVELIQNGNDLGIDSEIIEDATLALTSRNGNDNPTNNMVPNDQQETQQAHDDYTFPLMLAAFPVVLSYMLSK